MGEGLLTVIDMLGRTIAAKEVENEQLRAEVAQLRQALAQREDSA